MKYTLLESFVFHKVVRLMEESNKRNCQIDITFLEKNVELSKTYSFNVVM